MENVHTHPLRKLKVIHLITRLDLGGAQQNTLHTVRHLSPERFDCLLVFGPGGVLDSEARTPGAPFRYRSIGSLVHPISPVRDVLAFFRLRNLFIKERPDIVHTHSSKAGILGRLAARAAGVPIIIHTFHGFGFNDFQSAWRKSLYIWAERLAGAFSTSLVFVSRSNWEYALRHRIGREDRYALIRSGIELAAYPNRAGDQGALKASLGLDPHKPIVTTIGNFKEQKNPAAFIRMAAGVAEGGSDAQFLFVGDGPLRPSLERQAAASGLTGRLAMPGWRRDIPEILAATDIFVLTSLWEGLPRALVEAMKSGLPPICFAADGIAELIDDGKNGFSVPIGDIPLLVKRVLSLLQDAPLRRKLGQEASRSISDEFDIDGMVRSQERLYLSLS